MIQVSYVSSSPEPMTAEALLALLEECRTNNRKRGITGMLLYGNGTFLQAIEGDEPVIDDLLTRICADPRHGEIQMLQRREIDRPEYAEWSMGFDEVSNQEFGDVDGLRDFGSEDFNFDYLVGHDSVVDSLLDHYRQPNWDLVIGEIDAQKQVIQRLEQTVSQARDRIALARLALESITEASRKGQPSESLVQLCESALDSLRSR
ncbi:MAG: BLUF domain-containing protein [Gammaproteobacteria bacterium]|nr:BLUF domain-containing protein [Gammaproteobacteria bacterium]